MKITTIVRITLEVDRPEIAIDKINQYLGYMKLFIPNIIWNFGRQIIGTYSPSTEKVIGRPKEIEEL